MKRRLAVISLGLAGLTTVLLEAQTPAPGTLPGLRGELRGKLRQKMFAEPGPGFGGLADSSAEQRLTRRLGLNAEQQNRVHTVLQEQQVMTKGMAERIQGLRTQLTDAVKAGDEGKIDTITQDLARANQEQLAIQAKSWARIYSTLNADQKARVDQALGLEFGVPGGRLRRGPGPAGPVVQ